MSDEAERTLTAVSTLRQETKARAYLMIVAAPEGVGRMYRLDGPQFVIGRSPDADIRIDDAGISRHHAKLVMKDGFAELMDLGSKNGTYVGVERVENAQVRDGDKFQLGASTILKLTYQDVLDEAMQLGLYDAATRDALTGIYNKKYFLEALEKEVSAARRHKLPLTLLMIDVDHFKQLNDTHGHPAGDAALVEVARFMNRSIRTEDLLARVGGEEFALVLRETGEPQGVLLAERLRAGIAALEVPHGEARLHLTVSIGIASLRPHMEGPDSLVSAADTALYEAKNAGRNRVAKAEAPAVPW